MKIVFYHKESRYRGPRRIEILIILNFKSPVDFFVPRFSQNESL